MTRATADRAPVMTSNRAWRLTGGLRKTVLLLHIVSSGTWFGLDVAMAVLVFTAVGTDSAGVRAHTLQSLQLVTVWPMLTAAMTVLISGVLLGLGSKWGVLRSWWIVVKLAITLVFGTLVVTSLRGGVAEAAAVGRRAAAAGVDTGWHIDGLLFPPTVSPTGLAVAFVLSVFKPWGFIRRRPARWPRISPDR